MHGLSMAKRARPESSGRKLQFVLYLLLVIQSPINFVNDSYIRTNLCKAGLTVSATKMSPAGVMVM
jgi:hypothetical protein